MKHDITDITAYQAMRGSGRNGRTYMEVDEMNQRTTYKCKRCDFNTGSRQEIRAHCRDKHHRREDIAEGYYNVIEKEVKME